MSDHRAIAAVTHTLRSVLLGAASADLPGASVSVGPPAATGASDPGLARINLFCFASSPNLAWRNTDVRTGDPARAREQRVTLPLTLHYLLSCHGAEATLVPQQLLRVASTVLRLWPVLDADLVSRALAGTDLAGCGLDDDLRETDPIRLEPRQLDLESLSQLWGMFPQVPYSLTLTLDAHVVLLQPPTGPTAPVARVDTTLVQGVVRPPTPSDPETHSGEAPA